MEKTTDGPLAGGDERAGDPQGGQGGQGAPPRVLIVKDRSLTGRRYPRALRDKGLVARDVFHGREAISAVLAEEQKDLLIIEAVYTGDREDRARCDDVTLLSVLRDYLGFRDVPMILTATYPKRWTRERREAAGVSAVVHREPRPGEVVDAVFAALHIGASPARPRWQYPFGPQADARAA